jgi:DNA-binding NarL/FixJ family response regulator
MGKESETDEKAIDERLRAVIADDDPLARGVIKDALTEAGGLVIAEACNGRQAVELALHYRPDVVIMDVVMPELDGILATRQILKMVPDQLVIVLTGADDEDDELGLLALRAGAAGFLSKDVDIDALLRALEGVRAGEAAISRKLTKRVIDQLRSAPGVERGRGRGRQDRRRSTIQRVGVDRRRGDRRCGRQDRRRSTDPESGSRQAERGRRRGRPDRRRSTDPENGSRQA